MSEDMEKLRTQIRRTGHPDLKKVSLFIVCTKRECGRINTEYLLSLDGAEVSIQARHYLKTQKKFKPFICKKEGTVGNTSFMDNLKLKISCKIILIHNIDTSDGLTNGQLGTLNEIIRADDGTIAKLIVEFMNKNVGKQNRENNPQLAAKYPNGSVIEKVSFEHSLSKKLTRGGNKPMLKATSC